MKHLFSGTVRDAENQPQNRISIQVFYLGIKEEKLLGRTNTNQKGQYRLRVNWDGEPDFLIKAFKGTEEIASSVKKYKAKELVTVNFTVGDQTPKKPSEFRNISVKTIETLRDDKLIDLKDDQLEVVAGKTKVSMEKLKIKAQAETLAKAHRLPEEALYGLINETGTEDLVKLAGRTTGQIKLALERASEKGTISKSATVNAERFIGQLKKEASKKLLSDDDKGIKGILNMSSLKVNEQKQFADILLKSKEANTDLWEEVEKSPALRGKKLKDEFSRLSRLNVLGENNSSFARKLKGKVKSEADIANLSTWDSSRWSNFVSQNQIEIPKEIEGRTRAQKLKNYGKTLESNFGLAYPQNRALNKVTERSANNDLKKFTKSAKDFDLGSTQIDRYLKENDEQLGTQVKDKEALANELKSWQRLYRLSPDRDSDQMGTLKDEGLDSAIKIRKSKTKRQFVKEFGEQLGGKQIAESIYNNASSTAASAIGLLGNLATITEGNLPSVITKPDMQHHSSASTAEVLDIPDLETLFGSQSFCECRHCRSVLSPAAYLVDLLEFLRYSQTNDAGDTPQEVLLSRRPDLKNIELSCENTNTALPYIDLVIEILENGVMLSNGESTDYSYQTTGTTQELQAQPENINPDAYPYLEESVYPFKLPFHFWNHEGGVYLRKLGLSRDELLRTAQFTGGTNEPVNPAVTKVHLGLSENEADIINGKTTIGSTSYVAKDFWGISLGNWRGYLSSVSNFLQKSNFSFEELLQLLQVKFINPNDDVLIDFGDGANECDITGAIIQYQDGSTLTQAFFNSAHQFIRLKNKVNWSILDLNRVIQSTEATKLDSTFLGKLSKIIWIKDELKVASASEILSWWSDLDTSVDVNDSDSRSFYSTLFLNKAVSNPTEPAFELNESATALDLESDATPTPIVDYSAQISAALNISAEDLETLLAFHDITDLTLNNLSLLHRFASAAKALKIEIEELIILVEILPYSLFDNTNLNNAVSFLEAFRDIQQSGVSISEIDYVLRHYYDLNDSIAPKESAIGAVLSQIQEGVRKIQDENSFDSDPTGEITRTNLAQLYEDEVSSEVINIIHEESTNSRADQEALIEDQLTFVESTEAIAALLDQDSTLSLDTRIANRYNYLLQPLLSYLVILQSEDFIAQTVSGQIGLDFDTAKSMLVDLVTSPDDITTPAIESLMDVDFINYEYEEDESIGYDMFPGQFNTYVLLEKSASVLSNFNFSNQETIWLYENAESIGWLNLNSLPVTETDDATGMFEAWRNMYHFSNFNQAYKTEEISTFSLLDKALFPSEYEPEVSLEILLEEISDLTSIELSNLQFLTGVQAYSLSATDMADGTALYQLMKWQNLISQTGASAETLWSWLAIDLDEEQANAIKQTTKAKYSHDQWLQVAPELRNALRNVQRDALASYLIAKDGHEDETALFEHYLIDVEMESCMLTSRIKQANSSVQLFVQRGFMALESTVELDADQQELWEWMKNYRVWEANRKVFLYPENWIEPELRTKKSEFFKELENELLQNEISKDNVEKAFIHYLENLDNVSNIEVVASYHHQESTEGEDDIDVFHVVGRTKSYPHEYYYRKQEDGAWTPWEKIDIDVDGNHIILAVENGRLFLFWTSFREVSKSSQKVVAEQGWEDYIMDEIIDSYDEYDLGDYLEDDDNGLADVEDRLEMINDFLANEFPDPMTYYEVTLSYSEYKSDKWLPRKITNNGLMSEQVASLMMYLKNEYSISPEHFCLYPDRSSNDAITLTLFQTVNFKAMGDAEYNWRYRLGEFELDVLTREFEAKEETSMYSVWLAILTGGAPVPSDEKQIKSPDDSVQINQMFVENTGTHDLVLYSKNDSGNYEDHLVLDKTPGTFKIPMPVQYDQFLSEDSFFYHDDSRGYFVTPHQSMGTYSAMRVSTQDKSKGSKSKGSNMEFGGDLAPNVFTTTAYKFESFYHPYSGEFIKTLNKSGISGFMNRTTQIQNEEYFDANYGAQAVSNPYPKRIVDFSYGGAYSIYNWELFFHAPMLIAGHLSNNQQFEEAQKWYHYIFNPTDRTEDDNPTPQRYWQLKPFFEEVTLSSIYDFMYALSYDGTDSEVLALKEEAEAQIDAWKNDPFEPHTIASLRQVSYMKATVMKYLDNLIAWGDNLFSRDTIESLNEATQLYLLAYKILGDRPEKIPSQESNVATYGDLEDDLDGFSNALVALEELVNSNSNSGNSSTEDALLAYNLYFCIPHNDKLIGYWDTIEDRLFKIRNCMNIDGVRRQLALFEPAIDPAMLVKAKASGVDLGSVLSDLFTPLPNYRFGFYVQKAIQFANDVQGLGSALLSALEKKDGEALALLRASHELKVLEAAKEQRKLQLEEAEATFEGARRSQKITKERHKYYQNIKKKSTRELDQIDQLDKAELMRKIASTSETVAAILYLVPQLHIGPIPASEYGGMNLANIAKVSASIFSGLSAKHSTKANMLAINAEHDRRWSEWKLQERLADKELDQLEMQIAASQIRVQLAENEIDNHETQMEQSQEVAAFLSDKYTNQELYQWMVAQLSTLYFQSYQLAYNCAKKAQKAFQYELASSQSYVEFGYWDSLKKGLLAGEKLIFDLKRMESAYYDQNQRKYELRKNISLSQLDPMALIMLKQTGECYVELPEAIFDLDYPGHYMRRIKTVGLSIPCVVGPYTNLSCTLTLLENKYRDSTSTDTGYSEVEDDTRFMYNQASIQSIATSSAQNDSGMFQLRFEDERYLPFEGAGAVSRWRLQLPTVFKAFDYNSVSDVILHLSYTAKNGGDLLRDSVQTDLSSLISQAVLGSEETGLTRALSFKRDFSNDWYKYFSNLQSSGSANLELVIQDHHFPYIFSGTRSYIEVKLVLIPKSAVTISTANQDPTLGNVQVIDGLSGSIASDGTANFDDVIATMDNALKTDGNLDKDKLDDLVVWINYSI